MCPLTASVCPSCDAQYVHIDDPVFDVVAEPKAEYRQQYAQDGNGYALIPLVANGGSVLYVRCFLRYHDPVTRRVYPFWPVAKILYRETLLHMTGFSPSVFNEGSAGLPGRVEWMHEVACHTDEFMRAYFANGQTSRRWRTPRRLRADARDKLHTAACSPSCKKRHL